MTIRPIIFSAPMVRALLEGQKTQTRRILKPKRGSTVHDLVLGAPHKSGIGQWMHLPLERLHHPYAPGDLLYVREAGYFAPNRVAYAATNEALVAGERVEGFGRLRPSIHMPRWASRLTLAVTGVKVERLQDIRSSDAMAEGVATVPDVWAIGVANMDSKCLPERTAFRVLWNRLHGPNAWDQNPWVVAVSFTVHKCNVDAYVASLAQKDAAQ